MMKDPVSQHFSTVEKEVEKYPTFFQQKSFCGKMWKTLYQCGNIGFFDKKYLWNVENCTSGTLKIVENLCYDLFTSMRFLV